jgi:hypothetical protein
MPRLTFLPAIVLLFLAPAYTQSRAVLRSTGAVKVNGTRATDSMVVVNGDRIDTDEHSSALLLLPGRMIWVGTGSGVVYQNGSVVPSAGAARITTATCQGGTCTTSSAQLGSGTVQSAGNDDDGKKKCVSPKKPDRDKDCDGD